MCYLVLQFRLQTETMRYLLLPTCRCPIRMDRQTAACREAAFLLRRSGSPRPGPLHPGGSRTRLYGSIGGPEWKAIRLRSGERRLKAPQLPVQGKDSGKHAMDGHESAHDMPAGLRNERFPMWNRFQYSGGAAPGSNGGRIVSSSVLSARGSRPEPHPQDIPPASRPGRSRLEWSLSTAPPQSRGSVARTRIPAAGHLPLETAEYSHGFPGGLE